MADVRPETAAQDPSIRSTIVPRELPLVLRARTHPAHPAVEVDGAPTSYAELEQLAARAARRLAALGAGAGDRVATTLPPGLDFAVLVHALPKLGAALVPVSTRLSTAERRWALEHSGARLVVEEPPEGAEAEVALRTAAVPADPQTVLYTSGTTARPRAVVLSHGNHEASALASAWNLGVAPDDRWLCVLPLFHVGGLAILLRSAIYATTAVIHERFEAERVADALAAGEATLVSLVPTMLRRLVAAGLESAPALRAALLGGAPVPRDLLEWSAVHDLPVLQTYGMTETASQVATLSAVEALRRSGSTGRPLPGVELRIAAEGGGKGEGEILVRGPMVSAGALGADGWLHTGDRGRLEPDGFLVVEGRLKETIVSGGENVSPAEVEETLLAHPAVADAVVVGRPDPEWGETVVAFVVAAAEVGEEELVRHCRARLAAFKVPRELRFVAELPRTPSGKLQRHRLVG